jgi:hypothetical protein
MVAMKVSAALKKQKKVKWYDHMLHCLVMLVIKQVCYSQVVLPKVLALLFPCKSSVTGEAVSA